MFLNSARKKKKKKEQKRLLLGCSGFFSSFGCCSDARVRDQALLLRLRWGCSCSAWSVPLRRFQSAPLCSYLSSARSSCSEPSGSLAKASRRPSERESGCLGWQTLPGGEVSAASAERPALVNLKGPRPFSGQDGLCFFPYLSSLSGNTFCCFFPLCLPAEGRR